MNTNFVQIPTDGKMITSGGQAAIAAIFKFHSNGIL